MKPVYMFILISLGGNLSASDHPIDEARAAFAKATSDVEQAEKEFQASVQLIGKDKNRKEVLDLFKKRKQAWATAMETDAKLKVAASPAPSTNTSVGLIPLWSDTRHLSEQAKILREQAKWIKDNWEDAPAENSSTNKPQPSQR